jgi:DHA1 family multidrug resistance protein-like MFS transporter
MADRQLQPRLKDSHDTLIGNPPARLLKASTGSFGSLPLDEMDEKTNNDRSTQAMDAYPSSPTEEDTDRDLEKEGALEYKSQKDEKPKDPNLVEFDGPNDPGNPHNFSKGKKWIITILLSLLTLTITFSSSVFSTAILVVSKEFHVGTEVGTLGVS